MACPYCKSGCRAPAAGGFWKPKRARAVRFAGCFHPSQSMDGQVLWSSHAAARLLGHADGGALMRAGLPVQAPGSLRLRQLGAQGSGPKRIDACASSWLCAACC